MEGCKPLARTQSDAATTDITNCYYTVLMDGSKTCIIDGKTFYILRNAEDWDSFIANIVSAGGPRRSTPSWRPISAPSILPVTAAA